MSAFTAAQQRRRCNDNPYSEAQFNTLKYRPEFLGGSARSKMPARSARASFAGQDVWVIRPVLLCNGGDLCLGIGRRRRGVGAVGGNASQPALRLATHS